MVWLFSKLRGSQLNNKEQKLTILFGAQYTDHLIGDQYLNILIFPLVFDGFFGIKGACLSLIYKLIHLKILDVLSVRNLLKNDSIIPHLSFIVKVKEGNKFYSDSLFRLNMFNSNRMKTKA